MIKVGKSLYARLVVRMAAVLAASAVLLLGAIWFSTQIAVDDAYDRILTGSALQIAENLWYEHDRVNIDLPVAAFAMLTPGDRVLFNVLGPDGRSIAGDPDFRPDIPWKKLDSGPVLMDGHYQDLPIRIAVIGRAMPVASGNRWAVVMMAQSRNARSAFLQGFVTKVLLVILVTGILTAIAGMFTLFQALSPLKRIESAIQQRDLNDLQPLQMTVPGELHAVVSAINAFMVRLAARRQIMQRVIGEAAHQLRTPVTALISQLELLDAETDEDKRQAYLERLRQRLHDLGSLVNQLLQHAMVLHRADAVPKARIDLKALTRKEAMEVLSEADRPLDLELRVPDGDCFVDADEVSVREALRNVLRNALKHGARSFLHIEMNDLGAQVEIRVIEDGPGIPETEWARVREPFSARDTAAGGASLGLSIVDEVMRAHRGELRFERVAGQRFAVILRFPSSGVPTP
ncbi:sensor histidine kinase [Noviherbaspirillum galbum]|uniref:histidine kinase n=1 Tax=Noviherbaspirillum galbum TaxID=2709383 RepID=A0A6B3SNR1_9BURK|nr:sensor histidine kinase [Noviherbaspirillum galbum]NEX60336.1 sensor histidine kinase [Noviherbaspirillum galbum]